MIGGYLILDFKGTNFITDDTPITIPGICNKIRKAQKPVLIKNIGLDGEFYGPYMPKWLNEAGTGVAVYVDEIGSKILAITEEDSVGIVSA